MKQFPKEEYSLPFFKEEGYSRRLCPSCGEYFWSQDSSHNTCGEASSDGCSLYSFIGNSPTKKSYDLHEMREEFLTFFEKNNHTRIKPYPVVARWRDDIYLTHASIIDFQPYVTEGITPPPANPLVIAQPCIRLVDIANTGPTFGRHLTIFEMGGHHAFNYPNKEIYWKNQTIKYHHEFVTNVLGVKSEEVIYKEGVWIGGGNAGPDLECIIGGLEVDTLVFMQFKVIDNEFIKIPIRTVDTGYGLDRYAWLSQGVPSCFHAVYGDFLYKIFKMAGITNIDKNLLCEIGKFSGCFNIDKTGSRLLFLKDLADNVELSLDELKEFLSPVEDTFVVADHTKSLSFILSEGVIPSNVKEGYLARLIFRRVYRAAKSLNIENKLFDIFDEQINFWSRDYPQLKEMREEIMQILYDEEKKFKQTLQRGGELVKRIGKSLKAKNIKNIPVEILVELYDSNGLPPEIVKKIAEEKGFIVSIPENFYSLIAQRHMQTSIPTKEKVVKDIKIEKAVLNLPETISLYFENSYLTAFKANVVKVIDDEYIVLDKTCFYPEGGGQPADTGYLLYDDVKAEVLNVQKVGRVIVHKIKCKNPPKKGCIVKGEINWDKRYDLMKNHTATHLINGAARRLLGQHIWQFGAQKGIESSRLDISHNRRLTLGEIHKIETLANNAILKNILVETEWLPRNEAEKRYGFRLYQGGVVPGKKIRIVKTGDWDIEACAGTHLRSTREIGLIKIIHSERIQDGVERIEYSIGLHALKKIQENEALIYTLSEILNSPIDKLDKTATKLFRDLKSSLKEKKQLIKELAKKESTVLETNDTSVPIETVNDVKIITRNFNDKYNVDRVIQTAKEIIKRDALSVTIFYGTLKNDFAQIMIMSGSKALEKGVNAIKIVKTASVLIGGGGGGKSNFAQGGGPKIENLPAAVKMAKEKLKKQILEVGDK